MHECGADLLNTIHTTYRRYVVFPSAEAATAVTLWTVATHSVNLFEHATRLAIHSPVKRCGKSRLLEVIDGLAHNPLSTTNISVPALFRIIEAAEERPPTLILDEGDRLLGSRKLDEDNASLVAILNNGFRRGAPTWRCVGSKQEPKSFNNFAFCAIAGIGRFPDTIEDRAINITMRRRLQGEYVEKFRLRTDLPHLDVLRKEIVNWTAEHADEIERAALEPHLVPVELEDRAQDAWEPLLAVAVTAGGGWSGLARSAAVALACEAQADDAQNEDVRLLVDLKIVFDTRPGGTVFIPTSELLQELLQFDDMPWSQAEFTAHRLARRLKRYGVSSTHNKCRTARGYQPKDFEEVFARYIPSEVSKVSA